MSKSLKVLLGLITVIFLFLIIRGIIKGPTPYSYVEFSLKNEILNYSTVEYVDTLSHIGLEYLNVDSVDITILKAQPHVVKNILPGERVDGFVIQNKDDNNVYQIFLNTDMNRNRMIEVISHELIHIEQHHSGRLDVMSTELAVFEGDTIRIKEVEYRQRPWEVEAYREQRKVERYIRDKVFN